MAVAMITMPASFPTVSEEPVGQSGDKKQKLMTFSTAAFIFRVAVSCSKGDQAQKPGFPSINSEWQARQPIKVQ